MGVTPHIPFVYGPKGNKSPLHSFGIDTASNFPDKEAHYYPEIGARLPEVHAHRERTLYAEDEERTLPTVLRAVEAH
jgi:hypothetical protein